MHSSITRLENKYEYPSFLKSAFAIRGSVTPRVFKLVFIAFLYACFVSLLQSYFLWVSIPISPFEYAGLAMGLILVFRINAGYDRWWEARKLWGNLVNNCRNLAIACTSYVKYDNKADVERLLNYITALPFLMKNNLRQDESIEEMKHLLDHEMHQELIQIKHKPIYMSQKIGQMLSSLMDSGQLTQLAFLKMEQYRATIIDCQGACERILKTPMPFVMAIKSRRFILLFLLMLPIALAEHSLSVNLVVTTLVSYALFSLDQIGIELQNPFSKANLSHLPLDSICHTIENNIKGMLAHDRNHCLS